MLQLPSTRSFDLKIIFAVFVDEKTGSGNLLPHNFGPLFTCMKSFTQLGEFSTSNFEK